jgi:hypothetical protein
VRWEADALDLNLHLFAGLVLEVCRKGGFNGGATTKDCTVIAFVFALFSPECSDWLCVTLIESDGKITRRLGKGLAIGVARRIFGCQSILAVQSIGGEKENSADGDEIP